MAVGTETEPRVIRTDPEQEYIASGWGFPLRGGYSSVASRLIDVVDRGGPGLVELMMADETVSGTIRTIKQGVLAQGMQITATVHVDPDQDPEDVSQDDINTAFKVEDFAERSWKRLGTGMDTLWRLLGAMEYRTLLAETVLDLAEDGPDEGLLVLDRLAVKDPGTWEFVTDAVGRVRGIRASTVKEGLTSGEILPRDKFVILPWNPRKSDPHGQGVLTPAYNPWNFKTQLWPMLWKYARLFSIPTTSATPPEGAQPRRVLDDDGNETGPLLSPVRALYAELSKAIQTGGALVVLPHGSVFTQHEPPGEGELFQLTFDLLNRAITVAIHQTTRASMESLRSSRSDAETGQDLLGLVIGYGKWALRQCLVNDLWRPLVARNFGPDVAARFTPDVSFGMTDPQDFGSRANAISRLFVSGVLTEAERTDALRFLSFPFGRRRRKSAPRPVVTREPRRGARALNVRRTA